LEKEIEDKLDNINIRIDQLSDRKYESIKIIASVAMGLVSLVFVAFAVFTGISLNRERDMLSEFRKALREDTEKQYKSEKEALTAFKQELKESTENQLRSAKEILITAQKELKEDSLKMQNKIEYTLEKAMRKPKVRLFHGIGEELDGHVISAKLEQTNKISFSIVLRNVGNIPTEPSIVKLYTRKPLEMGSKSSDEKDYDYECVITPDDMPRWHGVLPVGMSATAELAIALKSKIEANQESYPLLVKIYYGGEYPVQAKFKIALKK
jgi:hypothetical protein